MYIYTYIHTYHYVTYHYVTLRYVRLRYVTLHTYIHTLHTLHYITLCYIHTYIYLCNIYIYISYIYIYTYHTYIYIYISYTYIYIHIIYICIYTYLMATTNGYQTDPQTSPSQSSPIDGISPASSSREGGPPRTSLFSLHDLASRSFLFTAFRSLEQQDKQLGRQA